MDSSRKCHAANGVCVRAASLFAQLDRCGRHSLARALQGDPQVIRASDWQDDSQEEEEADFGRDQLTVKTTGSCSRWCSVALRGIV